MISIINFLKYSLLFLMLSLTTSAQNKKFYTHKNFGTYYEEFAYQQDLINFLEIKKNDVVADVGTDDGTIMLALSLLYDNITFYAEDTDPKRLNHKHFDKSINYFTKLRDTPQTNQFHLTIGTYKTTNLPANTFDKILLAASFHEFTYMDSMITDLNEKLKPDGKICILEAFSLKDKTIYCDDHHRGFRIEEVEKIMTNHGFYLTKMRNPEGNTVNYANCLVFERNQEKSKKFYETQKAMEPYIEKTRLFDNKMIALDLKRLENITDSIKTASDKITSIYSAYECWVRDIGLKWLNKKDYLPAINIFKSLCVLYPNSSLNYFYLAKAYESNKQKDFALVNYNKAYKIEPTNMDIEKKLKRIQK